ncbi:MAG: hypothetical protein K8U57_22300 [Planctomycetes bacterium]|nr:hypothetical protein [Planctomycetota bacterium]
MRQIPAALLVCSVFAVAGCGSGPDMSPIAPRSYDPEAMAKSAIVQLDKNANGTIEGAELDACPGLKAALPAFDTNKDNKLSADELKARFDGYKAVAAVGFTIRVTLDGTPLPDATVTLTPELFMNGAIVEATGRTGPDGSVMNYTVENRELPGLPPGVYRVSVTKDGANIPAKYNTQTILGCEVTGSGRGGIYALDVKIISK